MRSRNAPRFMVSMRIPWGHAWRLAALVLLEVGSAWGQSLVPSTPLLTLPTGGVAQLNAGVMESDELSLRIDPESESGAWILYLRRDASIPAPSGKPARDLSWRVEGASMWRSLEDADQIVASGVGPTTVTMRLRARLRWAADPPGPFRADLTYTLVIP